MSHDAQTALMQVLGGLMLLVLVSLLLAVVTAAWQSVKRRKAPAIRPFIPSQRSGVER